MGELETQLKHQIIEALNLDDVDLEEIKDDTPLFGEGFGLDSVDALELVVMMERSYGIKITDIEVGRAAFASVSTLAEFIQSQPSA